MNKKWELILSDGKKIYRKEILRSGSFVTSDDIEFTVTEDNLHHMKSTFDTMLANGIKVPVPLEHTTDPAANRGWVKGMEVAGDRLLATIELSEEVTDPTLYDVSVYIPQVWKDGNGNEYNQPIRHVALTSYPTITGLGEFQAIVCSLNPQGGGKEMSIDYGKLGTDLGIEETMSEENAVTLLLAHFKKKDETHLSEVSKLKEDLEAAKRPEKKSVEALKELAASHPGLIKLGANGRKAQLEALTGKAISPAVRDGLVGMFCSEEAIALSLDESETLFDELVKVLEKNSLVDLDELTGPQGKVIKLSDPAKGGGIEDNPLVANAKARAKAAK